jgi:hypothetical protein
MRAQGCYASTLLGTVRTRRVQKVRCLVVLLSRHPDGHPLGMPFFQWKRPTLGGAGALACLSPLLAAGAQSDPFALLLAVASSAP